MLQQLKAIYSFLKKHTVLFGKSRIHGMRGAVSNRALDEVTLLMRWGTVLAKTFPSAGYNHNTYTYNGTSYLEKSASSPYEQQSNEERAADHYSDFVNNPSFKNPSVSFFGETGFILIDLIKVPITILINIVRLVTEVPLYLTETAFQHLLEASKLKLKTDVRPKLHFDAIAADRKEPVTLFNRLIWSVLSGLGIVVGALGYYTFKMARLSVRLVTAPVDSAESGWHVYPAIGVISGLLSTGVYILGVMFAPPLVVNVAGVKVAGIVTRVIVAIKAVFPAALPVFTALASGVGMGITLLFTKARNYFAGKFKNKNAELDNSLDSTTAPPRVSPQFSHAARNRATTYTTPSVRQKAVPSRRSLAQKQGGAVSDDSMLAELQTPTKF